MTVLAVDPGMSGAVVRLGADVLDVRTDFKHIEDLTRAVDELAEGATHAVVELVASRPGQGVKSMFTFGFAAGVAIGALHSNGFSIFDRTKKPLVEVAPQKWQNYFWKLIGDPEDGDSGDPLAMSPFDSKGFVRRFFPGAEIYLSRVKDHNTADAILMAIWYACTLPEFGSLRERDADRICWLKKRFNRQLEKD